MPRPRAKDGRAASRHVRQTQGEATGARIFWEKVTNVGLVGVRSFCRLASKAGEQPGAWPPPLDFSKHNPITLFAATRAKRETAQTNNDPRATREQKVISQNSGLDVVPCRVYGEGPPAIP